jgi:glycosyl transferase, family 25
VKSMNPKIVIINLPSSVDRRNAITKHLASLGLEGVFFPAIDGRELSEAEITEVYDLSRAETTEWGQLTRGEIGCALSHRGVWKQLVESGDSGWLVIEDDILLALDVPKWLGKLRELAREGDVIPFVKTSATPYYFRRVRLDSRWLVYPNQAFIGAMAYYITPLAARRLLEASTPIWFPIDCWYSRPGFKGVTPVRAVWPEAVGLADESIEASTIGFRQAQDKNRRKKTFQKSYLRQQFGKFRRYIKNRFLIRPARFE